MRKLLFLKIVPSYHTKVMPSTSCVSHVDIESISSSPHLLTWEGWTGWTLQPFRLQCFTTDCVSSPHLTTEVHNKREHHENNIPGILLRVNILFLHYILYTFVHFTLDNKSCFLQNLFMWKKAEWGKSLRAETLQEVLGYLVNIQCIY